MTAARTKRIVSRWSAHLPLAWGRDMPAMPQIGVIDEDDPEDNTTNIFFRGKAALRRAKRLARDLKACGVALVYPGDRDIVVIVGSTHQVIEVGVYSGPARVYVYQPRSV